MSSRGNGGELMTGVTEGGGVAFDCMLQTIVVENDRFLNFLPDWLEGVVGPARTDLTPIRALSR